MEKILIVEDEPDMVMGLKDNLELEGYQVVTALDGERAVEVALQTCPDLILLDIMIPKLNGFEVCKQLRQKGMDVPIIMLTAKSQEVDKVLGLELGADDYMTKPFSIRELLARIKAVLRRPRRPPEKIDSYAFGNVTVDFRKQVAVKGGQPLSPEDLAAINKLQDDARFSYVLFESPADAYKAVKNGALLTEINIGGMHSTSGKREILDHIFVDDEDVKYIKGLRELGIKLDFRDLPDSEKTDVLSRL